MTVSAPATPTGLGPQLIAAIPGSLRKLDPRALWSAPVILVVWAGAALLTVIGLIELITGITAPSGGQPTPRAFTLVIAVILWATVLFANLAESVAEGRGAAQATALRKTRADTMARRVASGTAQEAIDAGGESLAGLTTRTDTVSSTDLRPGDYVVVEAGEVIPGDGDVVLGIASVDESAITGESAPVIRESGGDRCAVTGGTRVLSDGILVRVTSAPGETFVDRMIALVEGSNRRRTPNEVALDILLAALSIVFIVVCLTLRPVADYLGAAPSTTVLIALLVCLIPTTIGALLSAIGIAGMDRLVQANVLAMSGRAVEAAGDVSTLLMDKTGTITYGNRRAHALLRVGARNDAELRDAVVLTSLADTTPEGRSIIELAREQGADIPERVDGEVVEFTATTRMSGIDLPDGRSLRKGAGSAVLAWLGDAVKGSERNGTQEYVDVISSDGGTPLVVAERDASGAGRLLGVIHLKDIVKEGLVERFAELRAMGIRTVMVTGDNERTARAIAKEAGVDDVLAEATPEDKLALIRKEQAGGRLVAMTGDGTNDAPALAQADVGVAMNTGTSAAKEAANMVDLDSNPTKLIDVVRIGKQLLITRGALTTFSICNDIAKYFAIVPAMFAAAFPALGALNIMGLHSQSSAILAAVLFNALVILALIPLALRGVSFTPRSASATLTRNLLIYGGGGVIAPFIGIKLLDMLLALIPGL